MAGRRALVVATYDYVDGGLRRLTAPGHDAEEFAAVLADPVIAGFEVASLVNEPHHVVGEAIADFYADCRRDDLALLYFSGHGLKDDEGRLYLAMTDTRRDRLLFTGLSAATLDAAIDACPSRRKVLVLDCCYSGAFPAGRAAKADEGVHTLERFQGKGRAVLTATDSTQYAFEGDDLSGTGTSSVFTRHLVEALRTGAADLDEDGDITLDELYSYVRERVVAEMPQQRPKKQEDVDGRIVLARNVHWTLPAHLRHAVESPLAAQRLGAVDALGQLYRTGNEAVRAAVAEQLAALTADDSRSVTAAATSLLERLHPRGGPGPVPAPAGPGPAEARERGPVGGSVPPVPARAPLREPGRAAAAAAGPALPEPPSGPPAQRPGGTDADGPSRDRPGGRSPVLLVLSLVVLGGVLQLLSRFLVFESTYTLTAAEYRFADLPWVLAVGIPLLVATQLLILAGDRPWSLPLAGGLVAGAALTQLGQALVSASAWVGPDSAERPGPAWWAATLGAVVLLAGVAGVARGLAARPRAALLGDWRAVVATLLVVTALGVALDAGRDASPWLAENVLQLLLAAACLPLTLVGLDRARRTLGLTAVTVLGPWVCSVQVSAIVVDNTPVDVRSSETVVAAAVVMVAACHLAQLRRTRVHGGRATAQPARH